jgi:Nif-specific regulatory protein
MKKIRAVDLDRLDGSRLKLLFELSRSFTEHIELQALLSSVVAHCRRVFGAQAFVTVMLADRERGELFFPSDDTDPRIPVGQLRDVRVPIGEGISGHVLRSGHAERIVDAHADARYLRAIEGALGVALSSVLLAPLKTREGTVGLITVSQPRGEAIHTEEDLAFLESLASFVALAIENAQMYERVKSSEQGLRLEVDGLRRDLERRDMFPDIVGASAAVRELIRLMESAAASPIAVLIEGETGTGKELVARGVHRASPRGGGPFLAVNCGAFTESLLENELFGHERGAFTGADRAKRGLLEELSGGTILLDEVGEMPPAMQVKLLRVLQEGEVIPVGSTSGRRIDVRVISASNRSLEAEVASGRFRADLYYRLAGFPIRVPPLIERRDDIPRLTDHLLDLAARGHKKPIGGIAPAARAILERQPWPGNVRQLKNELERAVALARAGDVIQPENLSDALRACDARDRGEGDAPDAAPEIAAPGALAAQRASLRAARAGFETRYIADVLEREGGNVSRTAEVLGISRVMLHKKLKSLGLR